MNISGFFFQWWTRNLVGGNKNKIEWNFYLFFLQYLKNGLKGSFTGKRVFHRGGRLQFLKKWGLVSFCLNQYKAGIFNETKLFYNLHLFYVICFFSKNASKHTIQRRYHTRFFISCVWCVLFRKEHKFEYNWLKKNYVFCNSNKRTPYSVKGIYLICNGCNNNCH